MCMINYKK